MEDIIFGTHATEDLRLIYLAATHSGLQHRYALDPRDPQPGQPVTLAVEMGPDLSLDQVTCTYTTDGSAPTPDSPRVAFRRTRTFWDTLLWAYRTRWEAVVPAQPEGTLIRYQIGGSSAGSPEIFADWPDAKATSEGAAMAFFRGEPLPFASKLGDPSRGLHFTYRVDRLRPPEWAAPAVVYQIFVDRFYPGDGRPWMQTTDLQDFCGGTLWGVRDRMDYIADLGVTCIWLSPIFPSPSVHGYDATDYRRVEPRMGGDEALRALVAEAHRRGLRILLDFVCNHVSNQHPYFVEARSNPSSPYRDWFHFEGGSEEYRSYFGVSTMPEVNLENPGARQWMIDSARFWLREFEVDGFRLDYATGPRPGFWPEFWGACKAARPDCLCFGEVVEPSDVQRVYVGRMDGLLDFQFAYAVRRALGSRRWTRQEFDHFLAGHRAYFPKKDFLLLTFLDNHDMDRFLFLAGNDREALRRAAQLQMEMPGPPVIYYGTEVGMSQPGGKSSHPGTEPSRAPMVWDGGQDRSMLDIYKDLIQERGHHKPWDDG